MGNGLFGVDQKFVLRMTCYRLFWLCGGSFGVIASARWGAQSAEGACDPGGGGGNKFELLDITEEWSMNWKYNQQMILYLVKLFYFWGWSLGHGGVWLAKSAMEAPWYLCLGICQLRGNSFQQIIKGESGGDNCGIRLFKHEGSKNHCATVEIVTIRIRR